MTAWQHIDKVVAPGEDWRKLLREYERQGWEAWHLERTNGYVTLYLKRSDPTEQSR